MDVIKKIIPGSEEGAGKKPADLAEEKPAHAPEEHEGMYEKLKRMATDFIPDFIPGIHHTHGPEEQHVTEHAEGEHIDKEPSPEERPEPESTGAPAQDVPADLTAGEQEPPTQQRAETTTVAQSPSETVPSAPWEPTEEREPQPQEAPVKERMDSTRSAAAPAEAVEAARPERVEEYLPSVQELPPLEEERPSRRFEEHVGSHARDVSEGEEMGTPQRTDSRAFAGVPTEPLPTAPAERIEEHLPAVQELPPLQRETGELTGTHPRPYVSEPAPVYNVGAAEGAAEVPAGYGGGMAKLPPGTYFEPSAESEAPPAIINEPALEEVREVTEPRTREYIETTEERIQPFYIKGVAPQPQQPPAALSTTTTATPTIPRQPVAPVSIQAASAGAVTTPLASATTPTSTPIMRTQILPGGLTAVVPMEAAAAAAAPTTVVPAPAAATMQATPTTPPAIAAEATVVSHRLAPSAAITQPLMHAVTTETGTYVLPFGTTPPATTLAAAAAPLPPMPPASAVETVPEVAMTGEASAFAPLMATEALRIVSSETTVETFAVGGKEEGKKREEEKGLPPRLGAPPAEGMEAAEVGEEAAGVGKKVAVTTTTVMEGTMPSSYPEVVGMAAAQAEAVAAQVARAAVAPMRVKIERAFKQNQYVIFEVHTKTTMGRGFELPSPRDFFVYRRLRDFRMLYEGLRRNYAHILLPFPDKDIGPSIASATPEMFNEQGAPVAQEVLTELKIESYRHRLHRFLQKTLTHAAIQRDPVFLAFLTNDEWDPEVALTYTIQSGGFVAPEPLTEGESNLMTPEYWIKQLHYFRALSDKTKSVVAALRTLDKRRLETGSDLQALCDSLRDLAQEESGMMPAGVVGALMELSSTAYQLSLTTQFESPDESRPVEELLEDYEFYDDAFKHALEARDVLVKRAIAARGALLEKEEALDKVRKGGHVNLGEALATVFASERTKERRHLREEQEVSQHLSKIEAIATQRDTELQQFSTLLAMEVVKVLEQKERDYRELVVRLAGLNLDFHDKCSRIWRDLIPRLQLV